MEKRTSVSVQVLIYRRKPDNEVLVLGLCRKKEPSSWWQPVTGGVIKGEDVEKAIFREVQEETGLAQPVRLHSLNYMHPFKVPKRYRRYYDDDVTVIEEYAFGWETDVEDIRLSNEHIDYQWMSPQEAMKRFKHKGNKEPVKILVKQLENET